jgi:hypothetical protein
VLLVLSLELLVMLATGEYYSAAGARYLYTVQGHQPTDLQSSDFRQAPTSVRVYSSTLQSARALFVIERGSEFLGCPASIISNSAWYHHTVGDYMHISILHPKRQHQLQGNLCRVPESCLASVRHWR